MIIYGNVVAEGKTKILRESSDPSLVYVTQKDDITAADGAMHDVIDGKAILATTTTCNVFRLLEANGVPTAFKGRIDDKTFLAQLCTMYPLEVVVRREGAHGSYLDRNPHLEKDHVFPELLVEFFLKTKGKVWHEVKSGRVHTLIKDDPLIEFNFSSKEIKLFYPGHNSRERLTVPKDVLDALVKKDPFLILPCDEVFENPDNFWELVEMTTIAFKAFSILEEAWRSLGIKLVDFKVEFGVGPDGRLLLADVIDNDSWRLVGSDGRYMDKQRYRDGGNLNTVTQLYREVAKLTGQFVLPS